MPAMDTTVIAEGNPMRSKSAGAYRTVLKTLSIDKEPRAAHGAGSGRAESSRSPRGTACLYHYRSGTRFGAAFRAHRKHQIRPALLNPRQLDVRRFADGDTRNRLVEKARVVPLEQVLQHQVVTTCFLHRGFRSGRAAGTRARFPLECP